MKKIKCFIISLFLVISFSINVFSQDIITIGNQVWMRKNLDIDKFRNGNLIPEAKTSEEWKHALENKFPAWCYYDNDSTNCKIYGKLYNWYAVIDSRGLAPEGWYIPGLKEWLQLVDFLGGTESAGDKMKDTSGWNENGNGTNGSGFSGLPGEYRNSSGGFYDMGIIGQWWSNTEFSNNPWFPNDTAVWCGSLRSDNPRVLFLDEKKSYGFSVRCVKE